MTPPNQLLKSISVAVIFLLCSCSFDDDLTEKKGTHGKTSLFEEVTEPDPSSTNTGMGELLNTASSDTGTSSGGATSSSGAWGSGNPNGQFEPGILTAGEWSDLDNWEFWNNLLSNQEYYEDVNKWKLKKIKRHSFLVVDKNETVVANAEISLLSDQLVLWKTKTDNTGRATLWSNLDLEGLTAQVTYEDAREIVMQVKDYAAGVNKVQLDKSIVNKKIMDIYFAVDATGSMGDEIDYLKAELNNVIQRIKQNNPSLEMRFGSVFYRDEGDEYVTRPFNFTTDEASLISFISDQSATGGGDYPEAVHAAMDLAITQNSWNENASARIMFLILDAPPHYNQEVISSLELNIIHAAEKGIKIIPITASGIDKATEYLMRSFAILTNGTYVFITDDSGVGNPHLVPTIGDYEVEKLNDLMVRLVGKYVP